MAEKSRDAFRTISEVAEWLDVPTHVLRFWESRFAQIKPVKRAGGRRYYRPSDMRVIGGVKVLLHDQGMTIRGVQKLFREEGVKHVAGFSPALFDAEDDTIEGTALDAEALERAARPAPAARATRDAEPAPVPAAGDVPPPALEAEPAPVFRRSATSSRPPPAADEAEDGPGLDFLSRPDPATADAASAGPQAGPTQRAIPPTPDVPETDPEDDDPDHTGSVSLAVRLRQVPRHRLARDPEALKAAVTRLRAVLESAP